MRKDATRVRIGSMLRTAGAAAIAGAVVLGATAATAGDWKKGRGRHHHPAPVYVVAPGYYYAAPPVYYAPPPQPVIVYPAPVAYAPAYPVLGSPRGSLSLGLNVPLR